MDFAGRLLVVAAALGTFLFGIGDDGLAQDHGRRQEEPRVVTDGRLRPGHLEAIKVAGFPGEGWVEVYFFPTAICEDSCGARTFRVGKTDAEGKGVFRVRMPGTFLDRRGRFTYFRDGERIIVNVIWKGPADSFAVGSAEPEPIIVRTNGSRRG